MSNSTFLFNLIVIGIMFVLLFVTLEDLFLDFYVWLKKRRPKQMSKELWTEILKKEEKNIAIIVANWKEAGVIERMVAGNIRHLIYDNYQFFIGVYPNDTETLMAANQVARKYPDKVRVVVNSLPGPTSKGQLLNEIVKHLFSWEDQYRKQSGQAKGIDLILMHDSEDIIHPRALKVLNYESEKADFIQTPIFSFERPFSDWIGSTYLDEFSELHVKDLLARKSLGAPVPSAGVGTCLSRSLVKALMDANHGNFLREDSLTEDYVLGMSAEKLRFESNFVCYYYINRSGLREFVATREYFPSHFMAAVKQKSRWIIGIAFQSWGMVPWKGSLAHKYFLWRDRRGPLTNFLSLLLIMMSCYYLQYWLRGESLPPVFNEKPFEVVSSVLFVGFCSRFFHRGWALHVIYGPSQWWKFPLRWVLGIFINVTASGRALFHFLHSKVFNRPLKWVKTTHILPVDFGHTEPVIEEAEHYEAEKVINI